MRDTLSPLALNELFGIAVEYHEPPEPSFDDEQFYDEDEYEAECCSECGTWIGSENCTFCDY